MTKSHDKLGLSHLEETLFSDLSILCLYLLGLEPAEKKAIIEEAYQHFFNKKLCDTIHRNMNNIKIINKKGILTIIENLKTCIENIPDEKIQEGLRGLTAKKAKQLNAMPAIASLRNYQLTAEQFFTDPVLKNKSQNAWKKTLAIANKEYTYKEKLKYLMPWETAVSFMILISILLISYLYLVARSKIQPQTPENEKQLSNFSNQFMIQMAFAIFFSIVCITDTIIKRKPYTIKPHYDEFDNILRVSLMQLINDYSTKKSELANQELPYPHPITTSSTAGVFQKLEEEEPDKTDKPIKRKDLPSIDVVEDDNEEKKSEPIKPPKKIVDGQNRYRLMHYHDRCYFRYNPDEFVANILSSDRKHLLPTFKKVIKSGNVNGVGSKKEGVTKVADTPDEKHKFPFGWKLRITRKNERVSTALRESTPEEQKLGIQEVFSPRALKLH